MSERIYNSSGSQSGYVQVYGVNDCAPLTYIWNDEDFTLDYVIIKAAKMIGTVTSATMRLHAESGFKPAGVIATVVFNPSGQGWGAGGSDETVTFSSTPSLSANTKYTVSLHAVGDAGNRLEWSRDSSLAYWASSDSGSTWDIDETGGLNFEIWGTVASAPTKATTPAPTNAATNVTLDQATLTWVDGGGADTFDVYYGESAAVVAAADNTDETGIYLGNQAGLSLTVTGITSGSPYAYLTSRYWRIDSVNDVGTTTGDAWLFTTIRFSPPGVTYFYSATGQYYQLLVQSDGSYGDPPPVGVEDTDYVYLAADYVPNFIKTTRVLVGVANSKIWFEDI